MTRPARRETEEQKKVGKRLLGGHVYTDGSCTTEVIREMRRAGCSGVEVSSDGEPLARITTPVPRHFRQTAQVAEHVGFAATVGLLRRRTTLHADCMGVVQAATEPLRRLAQGLHFLRRKVLEHHLGAVAHGKQILDASLADQLSPRKNAHAVTNLLHLR